MSVVRLELRVPDDTADSVAEDLHRQHVSLSKMPAGCTAASVRVFSDGEIHREQIILAALDYFAK